MNEEQLDSPDLISSFETSATEIEVLAYKPLPKSDYNACVLMTFKFTTRPILQYRQEYQQGPVHVGRGTMVLRAYGWTDEQIKRYKKMRDSEDLALLGLVDDQLKSAMEMLGEDLDKYIAEAEGTIVEDDKKATPGPKSSWEKISGEDSVFDPFISLFKGFWDIGKVFVPSQIKKSGKPSSKPKGDPDKAAKEAAGAMWQVYNNYKKAHGLLSW